MAHYIFLSLRLFLSSDHFGLTALSVLPEASAAVSWSELPRALYQKLVSYCPRSNCPELSTRSLNSVFLVCAGAVGGFLSVWGLPCHVPPCPEGFRCVGCSPGLARRSLWKVLWAVLWSRDLQLGFILPFALLCVSFAGLVRWWSLCRSWFLLVVAFPRALL